MIVEESRLQALTSLYATTKDMFLQANSHRLWALALLVFSLVLLGVLFFLVEGTIRSMISIGACLIAFVVLLSELYLSRRLSLTRSVLVNIEGELSGHIADYLGKAQEARNETEDINEGEPKGPAVPLWPLSLMSGKVTVSSLISTDTRNWIVFIHGLAAYVVLIPLGIQIIRTGEIEFFNSALTMSFVLGLAIYSILFIYVVASEVKTEAVTLGRSEALARDRGRKMAWRSFGAVTAVVGPFLVYAIMSTRAQSMVDQLIEVLRGIGTGIKFWALVVLAAGVVMFLVSLAWREVGARKPAGEPSAGEPSAGEPSAGEPSAGEPSAGEE